MADKNQHCYYRNQVFAGGKMCNRNRHSSHRRCKFIQRIKKQFNVILPTELLTLSPAERFHLSAEALDAHRCRALIIEAFVKFLANNHRTPICSNSMFQASHVSMLKLLNQKCYYWKMQSCHCMPVIRFKKSCLWGMSMNWKEKAKANKKNVFNTKKQNKKTKI